MKILLHNSVNKSQLNALLLKVWGSSDAYTRLKDRNVLLVVEGLVYKFGASNGKVTTDILPILSSNQEETDTRVILYIGYAAKSGFENVVIRSPDSDIFFILLHFSNQFPTLTIYFDTGSGKHRQIINISDTATNFGQNYCTALLGMHIFTGEDCASAFKGKGKIGPLKKMLKFPRFQKAFEELGLDWSLNPNTLSEVEKFVCAMYGHLILI